MSWFIDRLDVYQDAAEPGTLPLIGEKILDVSDLATGEWEKATPTCLVLKSDSTSLLLRCDGIRVIISGNPSHWGRPDNLFGFAIIEEAIAVYNRILEDYGLPLFKRCEHQWFRQGEDGKHAGVVVDGAVITRIDWTRNLSVGRNNERHFIRALSSMTVGRGRKPYLYQDENTTDWGKGSTWRYTKIYNKAHDLERNRKKKLKNATSFQEKYYDDLIAYCKENGIVREEHEFKRAFLAKKNMRYWGWFDEKKFFYYLEEIEEVMKKLEVEAFDYVLIADQLLEKEIVKTMQAANATQNYAFAWLHGKTFERNSQFYVHHRRLLELGIDISVKYDATRTLNPQIKFLRSVEVQVAQPPDWYAMPVAA